MVVFFSFKFDTDSFIRSIYYNACALIFFFLGNLLIGNERATLKFYIMYASCIFVMCKPAIHDNTLATVTLS